MIALVRLSMLGLALGANAPDNCNSANWHACATLLSDARYPEVTGRPVDAVLVHHALAAIGEACDAGTAAACIVASRLAADGLEPIVAPDVGRARRLTERACQLGLSHACELIHLADAPPPDATTVAEVREALVRRRIAEWPRSDEADQARPLCVAFGVEADLQGSDPPSEFMTRLRDVPVVRPLSWCQDHGQGDVLGLGNVHRTTGWPPREGLEVWSVFFAWDGKLQAQSQWMARQEGRWQVYPYSRPDTPAPPVTNDRAEDRQHIRELLEGYARVWNAGEDTGIAGESLGNEARMREHTRLEVEDAEIAFNESGPHATYAVAALSLRGTFQPGPARRWPVEPWKQHGVLTTVEVHLRRVDGWWRSGNWKVQWTEAPWRVHGGVPGRGLAR